jgi:5'-deoxynucleotidase
MKYINRWGLVRNTSNENICEHSLDVAIISHALAIIKNKRCGGNVDAQYAALVGLYHDASEVLTGDLPTSVKYVNSEIFKEYKKIEKLAARKLIGMLPDYLKLEYDRILEPPDDEIVKLVKGADKLSALIKCIGEGKAANAEFMSFEKGILDELIQMNAPEINIFLEDFLPACRLSLGDPEFVEDLTI